MSDALRSALAAALEAPVTGLRAVSGGDINDAYEATLVGGRRVFVKTRADAAPDMYTCEADGLAWLAQAEALPVPEVLAARQDMLVLAWVDSGARVRDFEVLLGRGLALLHRWGAPCFGYARDNYIANLPQHNQPTETWSEFQRARRLAPLVERAHARGLLEARDCASFERLYARLPKLSGPSEPPARLHGDLWSGNVHADARGRPMLIDPAVYGGSREVDLAMLQLFGSPSARFFAAYDEVYPRAPQHAERVALYQLYPLLVHVNLFGGGYAAQLRSALARYV